VELNVPKIFREDQEKSAQFNSAVEKIEELKNDSDSAIVRRLAQNLHATACKQVRDQATVALNYMVGEGIRFDHPEFFGSLTGLPVTTVLFGASRVSFKLRIAKDENVQTKDFTQVYRTIKWFADQADALEAAAQRIGALGNERTQHREEMEDVVAQSARGVSGFERALFRLRGLLARCDPEYLKNLIAARAKQADEEPALPVPELSKALIKRYNKLAAACGLEKLKVT
jgi:hypothetical protein